MQFNYGAAGRVVKRSDKTKLSYSKERELYRRKNGELVRHRGTCGDEESTIPEDGDL